MAYFIGVFLALAICLMGTAVGLDRDRAFYPIMVMVIASYYALFAIMGGSLQALIVESLVFSGFLLVAIVGFKQSLWLVAAALAAHGVFDFVRTDLIANPGAPAWWPMFCLTFDVTAAGYLLWALASSRMRARSL